jgi:hypothetical protein
MCPNLHDFKVILPHLRNRVGRNWGCSAKCLLTSGGSLMSSVEEYRRSAASLLDLAQRTDSVADKKRLLVMAEAWLDLANRATKPNAGDRPQVTSTDHGAEAEWATVVHHRRA